MELLTYLGYTAFGPFLGGMIANILSNRADSGLKQMEAMLAAKLQDGQLPANHDLQQAVSDALRQALRGLALALAASHHPASPFLREIRQQLLNPQDRANSVTTLLDVPLWTALDRTERGWIDAFARLIEDTAALSRLAGLGLAAEGGVDALLEETPTSRRGERLRLAVAEWLDSELHGVPGRPTMLDEYLEQGWPVADHTTQQNPLPPGEGRVRGYAVELNRIKLFQAWCWFFREAIKDRPKVFNIYVAETLADLKRQLSATRPELAPELAQLPSADMESFGDSLTAEFAELKTWLESRFDRLGDTQAEHTSLLRKILTEIGGFPALWRAHRWWRYGIIGFAVLVLAGMGFIVYQNWQIPEKTQQAVTQSQSREALASYFRADIKKTFEKKKAEAEQQGQYSKAILELERWRDMQLGRVDDLVEDLSGWTGETTQQAKNILLKEGTDAALAYLESHRLERQARVRQHRQSAEAAEEKLRQDAQALFLEAELQQTRYQWEPALAALREAAEVAPHWWATHWRLGELLRNKAKYAESLPELQAALALADGDVNRSNAMNSLAMLYQLQEHWAEAEAFYRQALAIYQKNFALENSEAVTLIGNLAVLLWETNRFDKAEPLSRWSYIF